MSKVQSLEELRKMRDQLRNEIELRERGDNPEELVQVRVSMGTCGIAAGAKETMSAFIYGLNRDHIDSVITQTGCMGHCKMEPTVEITLPKQDPIIFGNVDRDRAYLIIEKYIKQGELVEDIIPVNFHVPTAENQ